MNDQEAPTPLRRYKRISLNAGRLRLKLVRQRDGVSLVPVSKAQVKKHVTVLASPEGRLTAHETDEKFPIGDPRRNKPMWGVDLGGIGEIFEPKRAEIQALFDEQLSRMQNPDLTGRKLLAFPVMPEDIASVVMPAKSQEGTIDESFTKLEILDPSDLGKSVGRMFWVFKKARTRWHSEGLLIRQPNGPLMLVEGWFFNKLLGLLFAGAPGFDKMVPEGFPKFPTLTCPSHELLAVSPSATRPGGVKGHSLLAAVSSHLLVWQTGLIRLSLGPRMKHDPVCGSTPQGSDQAVKEKRMKGKS